jgi:hypothetical protein
MHDGLYHVLLIALFVVVPETFLILSLRGVRSICHELSNRRFFEPSAESISWHLLALLAGISLLQLV